MTDTPSPEATAGRLYPDRGNGCISGCAYGMDEKFRHHAYCETFGGGFDAPVFIGDRPFVGQAAVNTKLAEIDAELTTARERIAVLTDERAGMLNVLTRMSIGIGAIEDTQEHAHLKRIWREEAQPLIATALTISEGPVNG